MTSLTHLSGTDATAEFIADEAGFSDDVSPGPVHSTDSLSQTPSAFYESTSPYQGEESSGSSSSSSRLIIFETVSVFFCKKFDFKWG